MMGIICHEISFHESSWKEGSHFLSKSTVEYLCSSPFEVIAISPRLIPKYIFKHLVERSLDYFCRIICNLTLVKLFIFKL